MLSRSNSNAADRVRRAKSTSSTHTASSGSRPVHPPSDPFVTRQQAETAALEAYYRAQQQPPPVPPEYRAVPPKLERRRSRTSGRTEGGHIEEARLGRRKSASRRDDSTAPKPTRARSAQPGNTTGDNIEEKVITRKRSVIPPNSSTTYNYTLPSSTFRPVRKSQAEYTDGSPIPRHTSALKEKRSTLQISNPRSERRDSARDESSYQPDGLGPRGTPNVPAQIPQTALLGAQSRQEEVAQARDKCLQDFQQKKIRERKSFILGPFQKRRPSTAPKSESSGYDVSLPPFNYADDNSLPPLPLRPIEMPAPSLTIQHEKKSRNFSESLKGTWKKVFRKASRVPSELPAQHIEGKHFFLPSSSPLSTPRISSEKQEDPFTTHDGTYLQVPEQYSDKVSGRYSVAGDSTTKSRVTSWTNSTPVGTWSTRPDDESADEHGRLTRTDSASTLRKATSFLGRPLRNRLRKPSKAQLQSSEESAGLYNALQEHINSPKAANAQDSKDGIEEPQTSSALATLPSQKRTEDTSASKSSWTAATIRSMTPDGIASKSDPLSPVTEVLSPVLAPNPGIERSRTEGEESDSTPQSQLHRRAAIKAPIPSKEQMARRRELSKNRWQSPLDELSPTAPRVVSKADMEDNPYELRSLSRTLQQPLTNDGLPHHAKISLHTPEAREDVLSPSVYSRATDGVTPIPITPNELEQSGTMVTITGHEVRTYSISPKKAEPPVARPIRHSQEWRRWLSDEMSGWTGFIAPQELALPKTAVDDAKSPVFDVATSSNESDAEKSNDTTASSSPALDATTGEPRKHGRKAKKRPSFMNDRYPMLDTGRVSSDKTIKHASRISSRADSVPGSVMLCSEKAIEAGYNTPTEAARSRSVMTTGRVISKHKSMAALRSTSRTSTDPVSGAREDGEAGAKGGSTSTDLPETYRSERSEADPATKVSKKPKSAFDLRANYKNNVNGRARRLAVHRKQETNQNILILEDNTIQNISAGPYASQAAVATPQDTKKENTPPSDINGLPALSSSEWLAAGAYRKRDARNVSAIHPAFRNRSDSKYSPFDAIPPDLPMTTTDTSPGQRLVSNWLSERKSKENSPAFV